MGTLHNLSLAALLAVSSPSFAEDAEQNLPATVTSSPVLGDNAHHLVSRELASLDDWVADVVYTGPGSPGTIKLIWLPPDESIYYANSGFGAFYRHGVKGIVLFHPSIDPEGESIKGIPHETFHGIFNHLIDDPRCECPSRQEIEQYMSERFAEPEFKPLRDSFENDLLLSRVAMISQIYTSALKKHIELSYGMLDLMKKAAGDPRTLKPESKEILDELDGSLLSAKHQYIAATTALNAQFLYIRDSPMPDVEKRRAFHKAWTTFMYAQKPLVDQATHWDVLNRRYWFALSNDKMGDYGRILEESGQQLFSELADPEHMKLEAVTLGTRLKVNFDERVADLQEQGSWQIKMSKDLFTAEEVFARMGESLYRPYFGPPTMTRHTINDTDINFFRQFKWRGNPMFAKGIARILAARELASTGASAAELAELQYQEYIMTPQGAVYIPRTKIAISATIPQLAVGEQINFFSSRNNAAQRVQAR